MPRASVTTKIASISFKVTTSSILTSQALIDYQDHAQPRHRNVRLGVSACLLGQAVRYDGGHKRDSFLTETLGPFVEWVPVCPEVEIGLPIPRTPIRLVGAARAPRLVVETTGDDLTERMRRYASA